MGETKFGGKSGAHSENFSSLAKIIVVAIFFFLKN